MKFEYCVEKFGKELKELTGSGSRRILSPRMQWINIQDGNKSDATVHWHYLR